MNMIICSRNVGECSSTNLVHIQLLPEQVDRPLEVDAAVPLEVELLRDLHPLLGHLALHLRLLQLGLLQLSLHQLQLQRQLGLLRGELLLPGLGLLQQLRHVRGQLGVLGQQLDQSEVSTEVT